MKILGRSSLFGGVAPAVLLLGLACSSPESGSEAPNMNAAGGMPGTDGAAGAGGDGLNPPTPGEVTDIGFKGVHRLSNTEYNNTIRDLLGVTTEPASRFVLEEAGGFDNLAEALTMSTRQARDYFQTASDLASAAFSDPAQLARIATCVPDTVDLTCVTEVVTNFGAKAFRRPLEQSEIDALVARFQAAAALGVDANRALEEVVAILLASPQFLYRIEFDDNPLDGTPHPLGDYEVASRLSYLMWASMPDDALFAAAAAGELSTAAGVVAQVDRMLADERSSALVDYFAAQWLGADRVERHQVDTGVFPAWDAELQASMRAEMDHYFAEFLFGDRPYSEFLTADVNFVDTRLAQHYGITAPAPEMTRVEELTDQRRGFLGLAGFLTHTSRTTRTSPIIRGAWVLDALWCQKLELPPNLMINELEEPEVPTTLRDRIAQHRADPACAGCHDYIDPIGLGLERFDGLGAYRDAYASGLGIDTAGVLPGDLQFDGLMELGQALTDGERFMGCAAEKLFTFGLGRTVGPSGAYLDQIVDTWTGSTPTLRNLIKELVVNDTFRFRRGEGS